jgi:hypothetical protein
VDNKLASKTSFNMRFATDFCVIFGPCHRANVAIVNKAIKDPYLNMFICDLKIKFYSIFVNQT